MNPSIFFLRVLPDTGVVDFVAGQYVALGLLDTAQPLAGLEPSGDEPASGTLVRRTYSIGSAPQEKEYYEFYISLLPEGVLTTRLAALKKGDRLFVGKKPIGTFSLAAIPDESPVIFVATGTGVAPYVSILKDGELFKSKEHITLIHGVRYSRDLGYAAFLEAVAVREPHFKYYPIVSRPDADWVGQQGYVQHLIENGTVAVDSAEQHIMLCGNPAMIEDMQALLLAKGFTEHTRKQPGNLHMEKYW